MAAGDRVLLFKAESIIQREAVLQALRDAGIEAVAATRDVSRKVSDNTVDLGLEGYSAMFDGFAVYVDAAERERAAQILNEVLAAAQASDETPDDRYHVQRFLYCSIFSMVIPVVMHALGAYHLYLAVKKRERLAPVKMFFAFMLYGVTAAVVIPILIAWLD